MLSLIPLGFPQFPHPVDSKVPLIFSWVAIKHILFCHPAFVRLASSLAQTIAGACLPVSSFAVSLPVRFYAVFSEILLKHKTDYVCWEQQQPHWTNIYIVREGVRPTSEKQSIWIRQLVPLKLKPCVDYFICLWECQSLFVPAFKAVRIWASCACEPQTSCDLTVCCVSFCHVYFSSLPHCVLLNLIMSCSVMRLRFCISRPLCLEFLFSLLPHRSVIYLICSSWGRCHLIRESSRRLVTSYTCVAFADGVILYLLMSVFLTGLWATWRWGILP